MKHKAKCQACKDRGWILAKNNEHGLRIEKCDSCGQFDNDNQAAAAAWPVLSKAIEAEDESRRVIPHVVISVSGGVADLTFKPAGVAVSIFDYDVEGQEQCTKDPDGEDCCISEWTASEQVISNQHWSIIKQSISKEQ